jgi:aldose 1-epimerase
MINADKYIPVDESLIPLGELSSVDGSPFDFTKLKTIGKDIEYNHIQLERGGGYDHCWVLNEQNIGLRTAAILFDPVSGRQMEVLTDEPGIQFYSGNFLDGTLPMKNSDLFYENRSGLCLETQHYPNSPNEPSFPSVELNPGEIFSSKTIFKFLNRPLK